MMPRRWQRSRRVLPWLALSAGTIAAGVVTVLFVRDGDGPGASDAAPTTTDAIAGLGTVAPLPLPELCSTDPGSLAVWTAGIRIDEATGTVDAVVRFENLTSATCELDLTDPTARVDGVESSVRLPSGGGWGELIIGSRGSECERPSPLRTVVLELNGDELTVPTAAVVACQHALLAFLPADPPVDQCIASDLTTAVTLAGLVVRNDGEQPCVLGALTSVELPTGPAPSFTEMAQTRPGTAIEGPVGPQVTGLGQGDVAYFQTLGDPTIDCSFSFQPARLNFADVRVSGQFPICTFVRLGPGHPYYGSPRGPLTDPTFADVFTPAREVWLVELDPFRVS